MIQATDRKLLDVRRQTDIEEEIKKLKEQKWIGFKEILKH
jgi:hypothetical protein